MRLEQDKHINTLEMTPVLNALMAFQDGTMGQDAVVMPNNSSVVAYINNILRGAVSRSLCR